MKRWNGIVLVFFISFIANGLLAQDTLILKELVEISVRELKPDIIRLPYIQGTNIYSGKKNEVVLLSNSTADFSTNNARQLFSKVPGLMIWENDGTGI
jgi:Fe(3+) dicitrate transport protein